MLSSYRELDTWQIAMELVEFVYKLTRQFPETEKYGLISQMQRAAVSIPANIAEGYGRSHRGDYLHHLSIARGSLAELETHITLAVRLGITSRESAIPSWELAQRTGQMLEKLRQALKKPLPTRNPKPETRDPGSYSFHSTTSTVIFPIMLLMADC